MHLTFEILKLDVRFSPFSEQVVIIKSPSHPMLLYQLPFSDNTTNVLVVRLLDEQQQFVLADRVCQMGLAQPRPTGKQPLLKRFPV